MTKKKEYKTQMEKGYQRPKFKVGQKIMKGNNPIDTGEVVKIHRWQGKQEQIPSCQ